MLINAASPEKHTRTDEKESKKHSDSSKIHLIYLNYFFEYGFMYVSWSLVMVVVLFNIVQVKYSRFTVDDDTDVVTIDVELSSLPICAELLPLCGCGLVIWLFPLFTVLLLLFVSVLLLLRPFKLFSDALQGNDGVADFYLWIGRRMKKKNKDKNRHIQLDWAFSICSWNISRLYIIFRIE